MSRAVSVHRCRMANYKPSMILSISFTQDGNQMAVGRENGDIEIWSTGGKCWFAERVLVARGTLRSVLWVRTNGEDRLFSTSLSGAISEWDLTTSRVKFSTDSYGGAVWTIAADTAGEQIAAACEDGLRLFDISNGDIQFKKAFHKVGKCRYLSVAWNKESDKIYTGDSAGFIRQWNAQLATNTVALRLAKADRKCNIWTLAVLPDGSVVSGDSRGVVGVWDPVTTSQIYSAKTHDADVLAMVCVASESQIVVVATGPDSNMACLRRINTSGPGGYEWTRGGKFRHHPRDVLALAVSSQQTLASGGLSGDVHSLPLQSLVQMDKHPGLQKLPPFSPRTLVSFSEVKRRFLIRHSVDALEVWSAGKEADGSRVSVAEHMPGEQGLQLPIAEMPRMLARIIIKAGEKLIDQKLSPNGEAIACADTAGVKIFRLEEPEVTTNTNARPRVRRQEIEEISEPVAWVLWVDDNYLAVGGFDGGVQLIDAKADPTVIGSISPDWTRESQAWTGVVAASSDGQWIAAGRPGGNVNLFHVDKDADPVSFKMHGSFPAPDQPSAGVTALGFVPNSADLVAARMNSGGSPIELFAYNLDQMTVAKWARAPIPVGIATQVIIGVSFIPSEEHKMLLVSPSALTIITVPSTGACQHQKLREYKWVLFSTFGDGGESLFVVERTPEDINARLPPPIIHRRKYGKG